MDIRNITNDIEEGKNHTFLNLYSYLVSRKKKGLVEKMDKVLIDGQLMVSVLNVLGNRAIKRNSFDMTSLAPVIFLDAERHKKSVYFVGSKQDEITAAVEQIIKAYPALNIIRYRNGYFSDSEWSEEIEFVSELKPDIVIAGLGTPMQEKFLKELCESGWKGTGFTCGGFLHQTASGIDYYPKWMDKLNLRWAYRIYDEPKLIKRYFILYPIALMLLIWDMKIKSYFAR